MVVRSADQSTTRSGRPFPVLQPAIAPDAGGPFLLVIVDTEEEFDWRTFSRRACNVRSIRSQARAHRIFDRYGVVPTYAVDYPVASQGEGYAPLRALVNEGRCTIGAHLHPWVTPPFEERVSVRNSYPCNLPAELERRKLAALTEIIIRNFGVRPVLYKAGRYGADAQTAAAIAALGYTIDCSVLPWTDLTGQAGPNFAESTSWPYWFGDQGNLLEIPLTTALVGALRSTAAPVSHWLDRPLAKRFRVPGLMSRARLLDRIRITPEGTTLSEAKRASRALLNDQQTIFTVTYHSPSLEPGNTPYVRSGTDLAVFLAWLEGYLEFFFGELGGQASTPSEIYRIAAEHRDAAFCKRDCSTVYSMPAESGVSPISLPS